MGYYDLSRKELPTNTLSELHFFYSLVEIITTAHHVFFPVFENHTCLSDNIKVNNEMEDLKILDTCHWKCKYLTVSSMAINSNEFNMYF